MPGSSEMLSVLPSFPYLIDSFRLIGYDQRGTGRSGLLRCPRLEKDPQLRDTAAAAECAEQIGIARRHYTTPDSVQDIEAIRAELGVEQLTLFGISYGTELALAYARAYPQHVERLILDSVVDYDDPDPFFTAGLRAMGPSLKSVCPLRCSYLTPDPGAELAQLVAKLRTQPLQALTYDARGRSQRLNITPVALFDLMFLTDYLPSLRAVVPIAVHAALEGDGALLARVLRESKRFDAIGSPRDFSVARYATTCETNPVPWDVGTPLDQRPASVQQRLAALPPDAFAPFDASVVTEDEVDLCLRWPDVPHPASATPRAAVPEHPDADPAGRGGPPHAARVVGAHPAADPGRDPARDPRCRALDRLRPARARSRRSPISCVTAGRRRPASDFRPASPRSWPRRPRSSRCAATRACRPRSGGRCARSRRRSTTSGSMLSPPRSPTAGGGLRGGSWEVRAGRLILRDYQAVPGVTVSGRVNRTFRLRVAGPKAARGTLTLKGSRLTGRIGGRAGLRARPEPRAPPWPPPPRARWHADIPDSGHIAERRRASYGPKPSGRLRAPYPRADRGG